FMSKAIAIVSGGLDSVTLAYLLHSQKHELHVLSIDYGQRHKRELDFACQCATRLNAEHTIVDLSSLKAVLKGSALTDDIEVPHGHYAAPSMSITVVPNRNAIFMTVAYGAAVAQNAEVVAIGVHAGDHPVYPDCRPAFIESFAAMQRLAVEGCGHPNLHLVAPFVQKSKADIVRLGAELGVPFAQTWSCYEGREVHCGCCGTCVERQESFQLAGVPDPTLYETGRA
ncbi:MAG: 7-cyano-7-deazaguanine synthase, partial [Abditibacteriota bacterium]|nr:7-cyano-7-deazaguanine synthase [Abditibacteriota bacterium]